MIKSVFCGVMLTVVFALPATAEFYRYQDNHGNTIYTDDYTKVPSDQREVAKSYDESISKAKSAPEAAPAQDTNAEPETNDLNENMRQRLEQQKKALADEFKALTVERDTLKKEKETAVSNTQIKRYNKKTVEFNARIKAYEEKRDAHTLEVEKFNARMAEQEPEPQSP